MFGKSRTKKDVQYITVPDSKVKEVKKYVFSLPPKDRYKYYPMLDRLDNHFYGSMKSLTQQDLKLYNKIIKKTNR